MQTPVTLQQSGEYRCASCGLTLKERSVLGLFRKGQYVVTNLGQGGDFSLAEQSLVNTVLTPDQLKVALGNIYSADALADIAAGQIEVIRPVKTILAQIILEQLNEECFVNVNGVRRGYGRPLEETSWYWPTSKIPQGGMEWQDEGNLFCTTHRLVLPSDKFTFIRLDRKIVAVQAFFDGVAVQRKGEEFATCFVGCHSHEAALVAAYVMAKVPKLQTSEAVVTQ
jgi:hypothetical protein